MSWDTVFPTRLHVHPENNQFTLRIRSLIRPFAGSQWVVKNPKRLRADGGGDKTARMRRLIWNFLECTCNIVGNAAPRLICNPSCVYTLSMNMIMAAFYRQNRKKRKNEWKKKRHAYYSRCVFFFFFFFFSNFEHVFGSELSVFIILHFSKVTGHLNSCVKYILFLTMIKGWSPFPWFKKSMQLSVSGKRMCRSISESPCGLSLPR